MDISLFYITTKDRNEAVTIARTLIEERFVACANIVDNVYSVYRWEGALCENTEVILMVKTKKELGKALVERVLKLHSYTCPCIVELPIVYANPDFLQWVATETRPAE